MLSGTLITRGSVVQEVIFEYSYNLLCGCLSPLKGGHLRSKIGKVRVWGHTGRFAAKWGGGGSSYKKSYKKSYLGLDGQWQSCSQA